MDSSEVAAAYGQAVMRALEALKTTSAVPPIARVRIAHALQEALEPLCATLPTEAAGMLSQLGRYAREALDAREQAEQESFDRALEQMRRDGEARSAEMHADMEVHRARIAAAGAG